MSHTTQNHADSPAPAMPTRRAFVASGLTGLAVLAGLGFNTVPAYAAETSVAAASIEQIVAGMTRRQKIEQMLMPDFRKWQTGGSSSEDDTKNPDFTVMNDEVAAVLDKYHFGGVILFANNVKETEQTLKLTMDLQAAALKNSAGDRYGDIPLLLTIDQEGGIVYRLGSGTALPGNMAVGATRSEDDARQCGEVIGRELNALKINVDFAPVFDTNNNPNNPVIGLRSFSSDPSLVSKLGVPMMKGIQEHNVATAAKHFPGHGDAATDSHTGLPLINKTKDELEALEFVPFRAAIENGVDMVMTAHIQYPKVETTTVTSAKDGAQIYLPATLSHTFMTDILRTEMGFTGVSVTDALNMDAIAENFGQTDAVKRTFEAGVDIALMPLIMRSTADVATLEQMIVDLEADAALTDERLNTSVTRILTLKKNRGILGYGAAVPSFADALANAKTQVGSSENRAIEREVADDAVTVVRNEGAVLPFRPATGSHVLLIAAYSNEQPGMELSMRRLANDKVIPADVTYESIAYASDYDTAEAALADIKTRIEKATHAVVISEIGTAKRLDTEEPSLVSAYLPLQVARLANEAGKPVCVMSISKPYDVAVYDEAPAVVAVYGNKGMDPTEGLAPSAAFGPNVPAGVEVIFGGHAAQGTLPVEVYEVAKDAEGVTVIDTSKVKYAFGAGITYPAIADEPKVDTSALSAEVSSVESELVPNKTSYTDASWTVLAQKLGEAKAVLGDAGATQAQVDAALQGLKDARSGLVAVDGGGKPSEQPGAGNGETPDAGDGDGDGKKPEAGNGDGNKPEAGSGKKPISKATPKGELPKTGDFATAAFAAAAVAGAAAVGTGAYMAAGSKRNEDSGTDAE